MLAMVRVHLPWNPLTEMHVRITRCRPRARSRIIRLRNGIWERAPLYGTIELRWRTRRAITRHWDLRFLALLPRSSGAAVDVGANIGIYSRVLAQTHRLVHAFEVNPLLIARLQRAAPSNVTVHAHGLSDVSRMAALRVPVVDGTPQYGLGSLELAMHDDDLQVDFQTISTRVEPLDNADLADVRLVKIDVEGHELAVLRGARILLSRQMPWVLVECEDRHQPGTVQAVDSLMQALGYDGYFPWEGKTLSVAEFDIARHQHFTPGNLSRGRYVHMFAFTPSGTDGVEGMIERAWRDVMP